METILWCSNKKKKNMGTVTVTIDCNLNAHAHFQNVAFFKIVFKSLHSDDRFCIVLF